MLLGRSSSPPLWHTLLVLGRVSNLPTVWSNCLAAWLLAGGGPTWRLAAVALGGSLLYLGGMYLNDYLDVEFDRQHRPNRPIPAGYIRAVHVRDLGLGLILAGILVLVFVARADVILTYALVVAIGVYDLAHKAVQFSPMLVALCRFLLYLVTASAAPDGVVGLAVWSGLALAAYVAGLSYLARKEATRGPFHWWPLVLLAAPILLALLANGGEYRQAALWLGLVFVIWILPSLRHALRESQPNIGLTVSGLLAGIVLVDLLAVAGGTPGLVVVFAGLFVLTLLAQRYIPAT